MVVMINNVMIVNENYKVVSKAVFNLEINQSGSYVPHGILNWVISKSGPGQTMILTL